MLCVDGTVSYAVRQGESRGDVDLTDLTYDGVSVNGQLSGGLGQLTDGEQGQSNFRVDRPGLNTKGYEWVGWRAEAVDSSAVEMAFRFDGVRNFSAVHIHANNLYSREVRVFRSARITFSGAGAVPPVEYGYLRDAVMEYARTVIIPLENRVGNEVRLRLYFDARWMMISEIQFVSGEPVRNFVSSSLIQ